MIEEFYKNYNFYATILINKNRRLNRQQVEDIMQTAAMMLINKQADNPKAYIITTLRNLTVNNHKEAWNRCRVTLDKDIHQDSDYEEGAFLENRSYTPVYHTTEAEDMVVRVTEVIKSMHPKRKEAMLKILTAEKEQRTEFWKNNTLKSHYNYGLRQLRKELANGAK